MTNKRQINSENTFKEQRQIKSNSGQHSQILHCFFHLLLFFFVSVSYGMYAYGMNAYGMYAYSM